MSKRPFLAIDNDWQGTKKRHSSDLIVSDKQKRTRYEQPVGSPQLHISNNPVVNTFANLALQKAWESRVPIYNYAKNKLGALTSSAPSVSQPRDKAADQHTADSVTTSTRARSGGPLTFRRSQRSYAKQARPTTTIKKQGKYVNSGNAAAFYKSLASARARPSTYKSAMPKRSYSTAMGSVNATRGFAPQFGSRGIPVEKKVIDTAPGNQACATTGTVTLINGVAQGDDYTQREGRQITVKAVQVRGYFARPANTVGFEACHCRGILVLDTQVNGTIATMAEILESVNSLSYNNLSNRERFKVLADINTVLTKRVATTLTNDGGQAGDNPWFDVYKKVSFNETFGGTTAAIGSIQKGALYWVTIGSVGTTDAYCYFTARCRFTDA